MGYVICFIGGFIACIVFAVLLHKNEKSRVNIETTLPRECYRKRDSDTYFDKVIKEPHGSD